ncbi:MAG: hypothetical protein KDA32_14975, partial [Phycisphaerales bacterium]|nr:hypothetical protein [Phycisphaerales bacterium]
EVYTEEQGWRYVSELETSSSLVDATGAPLTIVAIEIDPTPRPVYNLETSCGTYFAQGVWAHNCRPGKRIYSDRVRRRAINEPGPMHNFPESIDGDIVQNGTIRRDGDYIEYHLEGAINGKSGRYEIGGYVDDAEEVLTITHRFFRPG